MGGPGSGSWYRWDKKTTVEECRHIDAGRWMREGILAPDLRRWGGWVWTNSSTGEQTASIGYEVNTTILRPWVRLFYTVTPHGGEPEPYDYKIFLTTTRPHFGGLRWWFVCPLTVSGRSCYQRVGKLYLPPGGRYYGCRRCYNLTYTSSQESDKRVSRLANDPDALYALMSESIDAAGDDMLAASSRLLLSLKAAHRRERKRGW